MPTRAVVRKNAYFDSVFLMRVAKRISEQPGVLETAALMGTEKNKDLMATIGVQRPEIASATPNDLMVAVKAADDGILDAVLARLDEWLHQAPSASRAVIRSLNDAVAQRPDANLAVISVPGQYAADEAARAMDHGLHVFLFSSNVSVEQELALKRRAAERSLLMMGPDCGTAIIGGVGLGFANAVRRGPIGVIGASGTGLQEFTVQVHRAGSGISHAIGTGGRDLTDAVGGLTALAAFDALEADAATQVIAVVSKPPGPRTLGRLMERIAASRKPVVTCLLGVRGDLPAEGGQSHAARTLDGAARLAARLASVNARVGDESSPIDRAWVERQKSLLSREQKYIRGVFAGGTFCYQAQQVLQDAGLRVHSNAPLPGNPALEDPKRSVEHSIVDLGAEIFTDGRAHPMIDAGLRRERILAEARDPELAVLLLDFILGFGATEDPGGDLAGAIEEARRTAAGRGGSLAVVASVCGTEGDPQDYGRQVRVLEEAGATVVSESSRAAGLAGLLVGVG